MSTERTAEEIRQEIDDTRAQLGDTVAALASRADVKAQAKNTVREAKAGAAAKKDELVDRAREATPESVGALAAGGARRTRESPAVAAATAFAAGILVGRMLGRGRTHG